METECVEGFQPAVVCPNFDIESGMCYHCGLGESEFGFYDHDEE